MPLNAVRFGTKYNAFCSKTQGKMQQNGVLNAAKCNTKKHKNPPQLHKQNLSEPRKTGLKEAK